MTWGLSYTPLGLSSSIWKCIALEIPEQSTHVHTAWGFRNHIIQLQIICVKTGSTICICKSPPEVYKSLKLPIHGTFPEPSLQARPGAKCWGYIQCCWWHAPFLQGAHGVGDRISVIVLTVSQIVSAETLTILGKQQRKGSPSNLFCPFMQFLYF